MSIQKVTTGSLAKNGKLNEVIAAVNSIISMEVTEGSEGDSVGFIFGDVKSKLITTAFTGDQSDTGGGDGGGGGGGGSFSEREITICVNGVAEQITVLIP